MTPSRRALLAAGLGAMLPLQAGATGSSFASDWGARRSHARGPAPLPTGYVLVGQQAGVPPLLLYGVALQESAKLYGPYALPWPWTLNVQGAPKRYNSYVQAVAGMRSFLALGIRNVDAGIMQVNWGYHRDKLVDPARALDPYPNMSIGARILREQFERTGDWTRAIGGYHSPGNPQRAAAYAALVFRRISQVPGRAISTPEARRG